MGRAIAGRRDEVVLATKSSRGAATTCARHGGQPRPGSAWSASTSTTSTAWTPRCRSRRRGRDGASSCGGQGRGTSASRRPAPRPSAARHAVHPVAALQSEYSLLQRDPEDGGAAACRELGIAYVAYSPLSRGLLTGRIPHHRRPGARRLAPRGAPIPGREPGAQHPWSGRSRRSPPARRGPRTLALAWLLAQGRRGDPPRGQQPRDHVERNLGALDVELRPRRRWRPSTRRRAGRRRHGRPLPVLVHAAPRPVA